MTKQRDSDGTEYAQFKVDLVNDKESVWMNPSNAEIHFDVTEEESGEWYVFATVRLGATVDDDKAAAYFGHYQPWIVNGVMLRGIMETADMPVQACMADAARWRTLCLGRRRLVPGSRIWVMPGVLHKTDYQDVRSFTLIAPGILDDPAKTAKAEHRVSVIAPREFDRNPAVQRLKEPFDNFEFARVAPTNTPTPNSSTPPLFYTVRDRDVGTWHVLVDVRSGAKGALESFAGEARVVAPASDEDGEPRIVTRWNLTGSRGDESWQTISLGAIPLEKGMRIEVLSADANVTRFTDVRRIRLVDPAYFETTIPVAGTKH